MTEGRVNFYGRAVARSRTQPRFIFLTTWPLRQMWLRPIALYIFVTILVGNCAKPREEAVFYALSDDGINFTDYRWKRVCKSEVIEDGDAIMIGTNSGAILILPLDNMKDKALSYFVSDSVYVDEKAYWRLREEMLFVFRDIYSDAKPNAILSEPVGNVFVSRDKKLKKLLREKNYNLKSLGKRINQSSDGVNRPYSGQEKVGELDYR